MLTITDRSYLIKDGKVVTHGTPQQLVHDPIAINEYLGRSFEEDGLPGWNFAGTKDDALELTRATPVKPAPVPTPPPVRVVTTPPTPVPPPKPVVSIQEETIPVRTPERKTNQADEPSSFKGTVAQLLEFERRRLVEQLRDRHTMEQAWKELIAKGREAVPALLEALERRELDLRHVAFRCLQFITQEPLEFQADAQRNCASARWRICDCDWKGGRWDRNLVSRAESSRPDSSTHFGQSRSSRCLPCKHE